MFHTIAIELKQSLEGKFNLLKEELIQGSKESMQMKLKELKNTIAVIAIEFNMQRTVLVMLKTKY